jgi:hypothetical protein
MAGDSTRPVASMSPAALLQPSRLPLAAAGSSSNKGLSVAALNRLSILAQRGNLTSARGGIATDRSRIDRANGLVSSAATARMSTRSAPGAVGRIPPPWSPEMGTSHKRALTNSFNPAAFSPPMSPLSLSHDFAASGGSGPNTPPGMVGRPALGTPPGTPCPPHNAPRTPPPDRALLGPPPDRAAASIIGTPLVGRRRPDGPLSDESDLSIMLGDGFDLANYQTPPVPNQRSVPKGRTVVDTPMSRKPG